MGDFKASYQEMASIASTMLSLADRYREYVKGIYVVINELENDWKGNDNISFTSKAKDYEGDLNALGEIIKKYGIFLQKSASAIKDAQDDVANRAGRI